MITYNISDFGAKQSVFENNGAAIQAAIDRCSQTGGRVVIPAGIWTTSPLSLKSGVELHLERGAYVRFTKSKEEYPLFLTQYEGMTAIRAISPITLDGVKNASITGAGVFDGAGDKWRPKKNIKMWVSEWEKKCKSPYLIKSDDGSLVWFPSETAYEGCVKSITAEDENALEKAAPYYDWYRPVMVSVRNSENILLEGVTFKNSPAWNTHLLFSKGVTVRNCTFRNEYSAANGDGIDIESCEDCLVDGCAFDVGDDAICLKAGKGAKAREIKKPCRNIIIRNCTVLHGHGGFVVGSEMSRGVYDILVENCNFCGTDIGVRIKTAADRGGGIGNITVRNIHMTDIKNESILISGRYFLAKFLHQKDENLGGNAQPVFVKDVHVSGVQCDGCKVGVSIEGAPGVDIYGIKVENSTFRGEAECKVENAPPVEFVNCRFIQK